LVNDNREFFNKMVNEPKTPIYNRPDISPLIEKFNSDEVKVKQDKWVDRGELDNNYTIITPGVYKVEKKRINGKSSYRLVRHSDYRGMPKKIYGKTEKRTFHFWNTFTKNDLSLGAMFTGNKGTSKSLMGDMLCNIGINNGMYAVLVTEVLADLELVKFLGGLHNAVIFFDEFGKNFNLNMQDKMLSMFSDRSLPKKFFIITENDMNLISRFILDRPGRVRYHIDFNRIARDVVDEFCADFEIVEDFHKELISKYDESVVFSFDQLEQIVLEHVMYPEMCFTELLEIMNLKGLTKPSILRVVRVVKKAKDSKDDKVLENDPLEIPAKNFDRDFKNWIYFRGEDRQHPSVECSRSNVVNIDGKILTLNCGKDVEVTMERIT